MYYCCATIATFGLYVPTVSEGQKTRDKRKDDAVDHRREEQARYVLPLYTREGMQSLRDNGFRGLNDGR